MTEPTSREMIPALLDRARPDRYDPADKAWQESVIERVAFDISAAEARRIAATKLVANVEASATKRTNKLLREIGESGAWPFDWLTAMAWPLAVGDTERVALRAATADDLETFANRERRAAKQDFASRNATCDGAKFVADHMRSKRIHLASGIHVEAVA